MYDYVNRYDDESGCNNKRYLLLAVRLDLVCTGNGTVGYFTVANNLHFYTWTNSFSVPIIPYDYIQETN